MHVFLRPLERFLTCRVCEGNLFQQRRLKLEPASFLDPRAGEKEVDGAVCLRCGYVHSFMGRGLQWLGPDEVKPEDLPGDPLSSGA